MSDYIEMDVSDNEVSELFADNSECLLTIEEEIEAESLRRNTPLSAQAEEYVTFEENMLFAKTYQYEIIKTDIDIVGDTLRKNYPDEDFDSADFQRMDIHKYLTSEMTKFEFFIAHNQWGYEFVHYPENTPIRMRKGVITRWNNTYQNHDLYHLHCIDSEHAGFKAGGFSKALLTTEARNSREFIDLIIESPESYFCKYCEHYLFDCIEHYAGSAWDIPSEDIWPSCTNLLVSYVMYNTNEETYLEVHAHKVICVVYPQENHSKKRKIEEIEDSDSD